MKQPKTYPNIDMIQTGLKLKMYIDNSSMSVKDIQEYLYLSCPQPIYRWIARLKEAKNELKLKNYIAKRNTKIIHLPRKT